MININSEEIIDRSDETKIEERFFELGEIKSFKKEANLLKINFDKRKVILEFLKSDIV